ncbi:hypothetical protein LTR60_007369, partial [Cryomyces antarcticus]
TIITHMADILQEIAAEMGEICPGRARVLDLLEDELTERFDEAAACYALGPHRLLWAGEI